jgi:anaerobic glycerol-3-phosphate dehydrogenase
MTTTTIPETLAWPKMPLSVYREVAAHLRQVAGIEVELLPQTAQQFDYTLSQVGGLRINGDKVVAAEDKARVVEILNYYGDRFGDWQLL